jgi:hypothetical protein
MTGQDNMGVYCELHLIIDEQQLLLASIPGKLHRGSIVGGNKLAVHGSRLPLDQEVESEYRPADSSRFHASANSPSWLSFSHSTPWADTQNITLLFSLNAILSYIIQMGEIGILSSNHQNYEQ